MQIIKITKLLFFYFFSQIIQKVKKMIKELSSTKSRSVLVFNIRKDLVL